MRVTAVEVRTRAEAEEAGFKMVRSDQEKYSRALFDLEAEGRKVAKGLTCEQVKAAVELVENLPGKVDLKENLPTKPTTSNGKRRKAA